MHLGKVMWAEVITAGSSSSVGEKIWQNCADEEEEEEERGSGQETDLPNLALQLFDCVKFALPAVLRGHLVLTTTSDVATQLNLRRD